MKIFKCTPFILFKYDIKFIVFCFPFLLETEFHIVFFFLNIYIRSHDYLNCSARSWTRIYSPSSNGNQGNVSYGMHGCLWHCGHNLHNVGVSNCSPLRCESLSLSLQNHGNKLFVCFIFLV